MNRILLILPLFFFASATTNADEFAKADKPLNVTEKYLHAGEFTEGENALLLALDKNPDDAELRFGLGVIQFFKAVENLGQSLFEYGAVSKNATQPFLRLPVPPNKNPSELSYRELGRVLDVFATDLARAEANLALVRNEKVKLKLRLAPITFDFSGRGTHRTTLLRLLQEIGGGGRFAWQKDNPEFRIHFDRGDAAWLQAYCHLLSAMVEGYRAVDEETGFTDRVGDIFPRILKTKEEEEPLSIWISGLDVVDAPRLRRMRLHLIAVCELNQVTWKSIRAEQDDDFEWLPHPKQTDQLAMRLRNTDIDNWLKMMEQWEGLLKGETLIPGDWIGVSKKDDVPYGINIKKVLDDPPKDLLNLSRLGNGEVDDKYLEPMDKSNRFRYAAIIAVNRLASGPGGYLFMARMN